MPKAKKTKAKQPKTDAKLSAIDAAAKVLAESREPMNCKALIEAMAAKGLWTSPGGATPDRTLYSAVLREINLKGAAARFVKSQRGMFTIILGHILLGMAYATVVMQSRLQEMDRSLEEAAMDLGCRPGQVFFLITLPNIIPALLAAWLLTFTLSFDDVVISEFLSGPGVTTLPQVIFSYARRGVNPSIYAAATLLMAVVTVAVVAYSVYTAREARRMSKRS